tara:strand:+ start:225 stop:1358 length:1134 start_codon:yes stop_codon:yes gene_type:complete
MKRRLKLKINGECPRSLFLAFVLANLKCDVYLYDFSVNSNFKKDYQIFLFSNFSKNLLNKLNIWNEFEDISYSFDSLSIRDNLSSEQLLLRTENLSENYLNTIGWTVNYSEMKDLLINNLTNYDNVNFISNNQLNDESFIFDYEFNFKNYYKFFKFPLSNFKRLDKQILVFNIYLRGHIEKRLYKINTTEGLLVLTPLNKNLYQIIWNNASLRIKETSLRSKSLFLDNLTTLLPSELKVDQIIGDINFLHNDNNYSTFYIKNKAIYFNENKFKSNSIYNFNFDVMIIYILKINHFLKNNQLRNINNLNKFGLYYFLRKYIEIILNFSIFNSLFNLFMVNNIFSLLLRKWLFVLIKRFNLIKILFMRRLNDSNINNLI